MITFVDADSIAYSAGYTEYPADMERCCDNYIQDIQRATGCDKMVGFIENPDRKQNFRSYIAVTRPYKGKRSSSKPKWMVEAKLYLKQRYGFNVVTYMESEDACLISANANGLENSIVACIDKDLYQAAGRYYDYKKKDWIVVNQDQAEYNLYKQILTGDSVDNIPGIPGTGDKTAETWLMENANLPERCALAYKNKGLSYEYFLEQSRLIYLLRERGEKPFTPVTREQWEEL